MVLKNLKVNVQKEDEERAEPKSLVVKVLGIATNMVQAIVENIQLTSINVKKVVVNTVEKNTKIVGVEEILDQTILIDYWVVANLVKSEAI